MAAGFDDDWSAVVCDLLDDVFSAAAAGFSRTAPRQPCHGAVESMLWEADAVVFAQRYPDSGIMDSYGSQWPPPCIDYWVYVDASQQQAVISPEGWSGERREVVLTGRGRDDAQAIAKILRSILGGNSPS